MTLHGVVRRGVTRRGVLRRGVLRVATAADDPAAIRQRVENWTDVTLEEMYIFFGIRILMGAYHRDRAVHYWHIPLWPVCLGRTLGLA